MNVIRSKIRGKNLTNNRRSFALEPLEPRLLLVIGSVDFEYNRTSDFDGVGKIKVNETTEETACTGTLLPTARHLLTADHCMDNLAPGTWYVEFRYGEEQELILASFHTVNDVHVHPIFLDNKSDEHKGYDIAIIELTPYPCTECSPTETLDSLTRYDVFRPEYGSDLTDIEIVGYGWYGTGDEGVVFPGPFPLPQPDHQKRAGMNRFEAYADELNGLSPLSGGGGGNPNWTITAQWDHSPPGSQLAFDFDNNTEDGPCDPANHPHQAPAPPYWCDAFGEYLGEGYQDPHGHGDDEAAYGPGDSGGPNFAMVNGFRKISGVTSHLLYPTLKTDLEDFVGQLDTGNWGEIYVAMRVAYEGVNPNEIDGHLDWIDHIVDIVAPRVTSVIVGSTHNNHDDYSLLSEGNQLRTIPVAKPNEIIITFSEPVDVDISNLSVESFLTSTQYTPTGFEYPATGYAANTAKWTFSTPIGPQNQAEQVIVTLSGVADLGGVRLDSEWTNPSASDDPSGSEFPSGDGSADGINNFVIHLAFVPADFNLDNIVDGSDFGVWNANKFTGPHGGDGFTKADGSGDDSTDGSDFGIWNAMKFTDWSCWGGCEQEFLRGGLNSRGLRLPSTAWFEEYERLLDFHHIYVDGQINNTLTNEDWSRFADALMMLLTTV